VVSASPNFGLRLFSNCCQQVTGGFVSMQQGEIEQLKAGVAQLTSNISAR